MGKINWERRQHQEEVDLSNMQHNPTPWRESNWGRRQPQEEFILPNIQVEGEKHNPDPWRGNNWGTTQHQEEEFDLPNM